MKTGLLIQITSTFTCNPIEPSLSRAITQAGIADAVGFTQPAQMTEYMLSPALDSEQILGTVVMVRVEDWLRRYVGESSEPITDSAARQQLRTRLDEFLSQLAILALRGRPVWFLACPSTGWIASQHKLAALCRTYSNLLSARARNISQLMVLNWPASWSASEFDDPGRDESEHIPFTTSGFDHLGEFLGSQLARTLAKGDVSTAVAVGSPELAAFLTGLHVQVELAPAEQSDRAHVDRILRTAASFSLTGENPTISEAEINAVLTSQNCMLISVTDRLSNYGPSGVVIAQAAGEALIVEALSLSCTVLGKQVEHAVLSALAQITAERQLTSIVFAYRPSGRNQPMLAFLKSIANRGSDQNYVLPLKDVGTRSSKAAVAPGAWCVKLLVPKSG